MSANSTAGELTTPRRTTPMQALSSLFRTPSRLRTPTTTVSRRRNKRTRARASSLSSLPSSTPSTASASATTPSSLPAVVLQTYSVSTDSIVLTALPSVPFCCHEDLLTMSRAQLEVVVHALNARLPRRMRIGPEDDVWKHDDQDRRIGGGNDDNDNDEDDDDDEGLSRMSEAEMRRRVEELVGIRPVVGRNRVSRLGLGLRACSGGGVIPPPAPKAVRTRDAAWRPYEKTPWEMDVEDAPDDVSGVVMMTEDARMGSSPLASRTTATSGVYMRGRNILPRLAILQEENEGGEPKEDDAEDNNEGRPSKRQRRVSPGIVVRDSKGEPKIVLEVKESRLIENMDLSGSPLLAGDNEASSRNVTEQHERVVTTTMNPDCTAETPGERIQAPLQRRRSVRIKEIALKRASSIGAGKKVPSDPRDSKSSILRSKSFSSRRLSRNTSASTLDKSNTGRDLDMPRELTIRLPFTSTPPHQTPASSSWSAPRILRSHSQQLVDSSQSTKMKASLGRSQSERYPRASDLAFVTINRPRYRFSQRKSKGNKVRKEGQAFHPSMSASPPEHAARQQRQQDLQTGTEHASEKPVNESEKENDEPRVATTGNSAMGNLHAFPSAFCSFLAPRSRAPSTSTNASTRGNSSDSPARTITEEGVPLTLVKDSGVTDGATERVWEAMESMAMDSV